MIYIYDGTFDHQKADLVIKGYTQQEGINFMRTFFPIAKIVTVKFFYH